MKLLLTRITYGKHGQETRAEETLEGDSILIGRGTDCKFHLPDPRVALHHATLRGEAAGRCSIESDGGTLIIDGNAERAALLKTGQLIRLGPYKIEIAPTPAPEAADIAMTLQLVEPLGDEQLSRAASMRGKRAQQRNLASTWLSKRLLSWGAAAAILLAFLVWPVNQALKHDAHDAHGSNLAHDPHHGMSAAPGKGFTAMPAMAAWDPGPLDSGHATFGRDCGKCHQTPFTQVKNDACESCHKSVGWHFPLDTPAANTLHKQVFGLDESEGRCAACHRDHKGIHALKRQDSPMCTNCHQDLKTRHSEIAFANITDLKADHPPFKLSMLVLGKAGRTTVERVAQDDKAKLVERSNLKFPHDVHLSPKGVRGPVGKQILGCENCHTPDETATRFKPISMKTHCQECHSLEFEPKATTRQVPHSSVADVVATINEFYAQAALLAKPIDQVAVGVTRAGRPDLRSPGGATKSVAWVNQKARTVTNEMMEKRVCFACHEITPIGTPGSPDWRIAPVAITNHWLPKSRFAHRQHTTQECKKCHDVAKSKSSADVAIPDLANCQSCHAGSAPEKDKAVGTCETCHGFHVGGSRSGKPALFPNAKVATK